MTANVENLILEMLRALRNDVQTLRTETRQGFAEQKQRTGGVEAAIVKARGDNLSTQEDVYRQQTTMDRLAERLDRVEKRLELNSNP